MRRKHQTATTSISSPIVWAVLTAAVAMSSACGHDRRLEPYGLTAYNMLEFETRQVAVRYSDHDGYPIQGANVRCRLEGDGNGAVLENLVAVTDAQGIGRVTLKTNLAANFRIYCRADEDDGANLRMPVFVAKDNGGKLEATIYPTSAATALTATIMLVEDFPCIGFDPLRPPASTSYAVRTQQEVQVTAAGTSVTFGGLYPDKSYSLVAIGRDGTDNVQTVAQGCQDNLTISQATIDRMLPIKTTLYLQDFTPDISGNDLELTTAFTYTPLAMRSVAGLLTRLSDGQYDPAEYILQLMRSHADGIVATILSAYSQQVAMRLSSDTSAVSNRASLAKVARDLGEMKNIKLISTLSIQDEATVDGEAARGELTATHEFKRFTVELDGKPKDFTFRDGRSVFGNPIPPKLSATTQITRSDASRIEIAPHTMSLPIADAVFGGTLVENFGDWRLDKIMQMMVACYQIGDAINTFFDTGMIQNMLGNGILDFAFDTTARVVGTKLCEQAVAQVIQDIYSQLQQDLEDSRLDQQVTFEGSANLIMTSDGSTIDRLIAGNWVSVGSFTARRQ